MASIRSTHHQDNARPKTPPCSPTLTVCEGRTDTSETPKTRTVPLLHIVVIRHRPVCSSRIDTSKGPPRVPNHDGDSHCVHITKESHRNTATDGCCSICITCETCPSLRVLSLFLICGRFWLVLLLPDQMAGAPLLLPAPARAGCSMRFSVIHLNIHGRAPPRIVRRRAWTSTA